MTLKKVRGGDRFKTGQVNQFVDEFDLRKSSRTGRRLDRNLMPGNPVWAVNKGSADLLMGEIAAIESTPYVGNAAGLVTDNVVLTLRDTVEGDEGHWAVAANYIPVNEAGWVYTGGICLARLEPEASGSIPGSLVEMVAGQKYLEVGTIGSGQLLEDLAQIATSGVGEWGLIRFPVGGEGIPGDTIPIITDAVGALGISLDHRRDDTIPGVKIRSTKPGMLWEPVGAGLGVKWATSQAEINPVSDAVNYVGDLDLIAHSNHRHKLFAGTGLSWTTIGPDRVLVLNWATSPSEINPVSDAVNGIGSLNLVAHSNHTHKLFAENGLAWKTIGPDRALILSPGTTGNLWYYNGNWLKLGIGSSSDVLTVVGGLPVWQAPGAGATHDILSATHTDTLAAAVVAGDLVIGNGTPKWARLGIGSSGEVLKVAAGVPTWSDILYAVVPRTVAFTTGEVGIETTMSPGDHRHGFDGANFAGTGISWVGGKFTAADVPASGTDGDILYWSGSGWAQLGIGGSDQLLTVMGSAPMWDDITALVNHNILDADFHADSISAGVSAGSLIIGNVTPKWSELVAGSNGQILKLASGLPSWADMFTAASHIPDPSGGATQDAEARTAINAILVALENVGILATS